MIALFVCALAMTSATSSSFNFGRYHKAMLEQAKVRYPDDTCAIRFMEYCLIDIADHFPDVRKMVILGSGAERDIEGIRLAQPMTY